MPKITVLGSYVVDITSLTSRLPVPGETVLGNQFSLGPGGKGSNQAVAAARLGAEVTMITRLGNDYFGQMAMDNFFKEGISTDYIVIDSTCSTGTAQILVNEHGENMIVVVPGANAKIEVDQIEKAHVKISETDIFLTQFEIDMNMVVYGIEKAYSLNKKIILNPAPANEIPKNLKGKINVLTPNEIELQRLTDYPVHDLGQVELAAKKLCQEYEIEHVIVTLGKKGALLVNKYTVKLFKGIEVEVVDTTGAGDAFNGGLATALAEGKSIEEAIRFANIVAGLSVTRRGTAPSMPYRNEVDRIYLGMK